MTYTIYGLVYTKFKSLAMLYYTILTSLMLHMKIEIIKAVAGWYHGIVVIPQYWNETISVLSRFQGNDEVNIDVTTVFTMSGNIKARRLNKSCDSYWWSQECDTHKSKSLFKLKHPNITINPINVTSISIY